MPPFKRRRMPVHRSRWTNRKRAVIDAAPPHRRACGFAYGGSTKDSSRVPESPRVSRFDVGSSTAAVVETTSRLQAGCWWCTAAVRPGRDSEPVVSGPTSPERYTSTCSERFPRCELADDSSLFFIVRSFPSRLDSGSVLRPRLTPALPAADCSVAFPPFQASLTRPSKQPPAGRLAGLPGYTRDVSLHRLVIYLSDRLWERLCEVVLTRLVDPALDDVSVRSLAASVRMRPVTPDPRPQFAGFLPPTVGHPSAVALTSYFVDRSGHLVY